MSSQFFKGSKRRFPYFQILFTSTLSFSAWQCWCSAAVDEPVYWCNFDEYPVGTDHQCVGTTQLNLFGMWIVWTDITYKLMTEKRYSSSFGQVNIARCYKSIHTSRKKISISFTASLKDTRIFNEKERK